MKAIILCALYLSLVACQSSTSSPAQPEQVRAKNIILLIDDGMGLSQLSASFYFQDAQPNFARFKSIGLMDVRPSSPKITDSAAGATAFAIGEKTYNGAIGVDSDSLKQTTILERAAAQQISTGLIATSSITHATPAAFYAHVKFRRLEEAIAVQLLEAPVDFFAAGGRQFFTQRKDDRQLLAEMAEKGYVIDTVALPLPNQLHSWETNKRYGYLLANDGMPKMTEGRGDFLPHAMQLALKRLSENDKGFFLMAESSQIDWAGHSNQTDYLVTELLDFDKTVGIALDFAAKDGNTLVIVTADHETGGFTLFADSVDGKLDYNEITGIFSMKSHSATLIPVLAYGPGAELFQGIYQNDALYRKMLAATQW